MRFSKYLSYVIFPLRMDSPFQFRHLDDEMSPFNDLDIDLKFSYYQYLFNNEYDPSICMGFLDYHYNKYSGDKDEFFSFVRFSLDDIPNLTFPLCVDCYVSNYPVGSSRELEIRAWIDKKKAEIQQGDQGQYFRHKKIKWLGSPAIFAFLMQELVNHGYIEPPTYGSDSSMSGLAELCYQYFEIKVKKGTDVDIEYFKRAMRNPEALVQIKKEKITIPDLSQIA